MRGTQEPSAPPEEEDEGEADGVPNEFLCPLTLEVKHACSGAAKLPKDYDDATCDGPRKMIDVVRPFFASKSFRFPTTSCSTEMKLMQMHRNTGTRYE